MYHVLMPVDRDEERVDRQVAAALELPSPVKVTLLHVYEEVDAPADEAGRSYIDAVNEQIADLQGRPETLDRAATTLEEAGIGVTVREVAGSPAEAILAVAEEVGADSILLAGRKRSPVGKALFGSVTQSVILEGDRTVVVAP